MRSAAPRRRGHCEKQGHKSTRTGRGNFTLSFGKGKSHSPVAFAVGITSGCPPCPTRSGLTRIPVSHLLRRWETVNFVSRLSFRRGGATRVRYARSRKRAGCCSTNGRKAGIPNATGPPKWSSRRCMEDESRPKSGRRWSPPRLRPGSWSRQPYLLRPWNRFLPRANETCGRLTPWERPRTAVPKQNEAGSFRSCNPGLILYGIDLRTAHRSRREAREGCAEGCLLG